MKRPVFWPAAAAFALILGGCGARGEPANGAPPEIAEVPLQLNDSLVLLMPRGATVWLGQGRRAKDSTGATCVERSVQIWRDSVRLVVPLLFTGSLPTMLDDSTIRAELYRDCHPSAVYKVGMRDGLPHRINQ